MLTCHLVWSKARGWGMRCLTYRRGESCSRPKYGVGELAHALSLSLFVLDALRKEYLAEVTNTKIHARDRNLMEECQWT
jgi:hypothetical protein